MKKQEGHESPVREHSYDGIEEYDKNLPNWWLFTLYGSIAFAIGYWVYFHKADLGLSQEAKFDLAMASIQASRERAVLESGVIDDDALWAMSKSADAVQAGRQAYAMACAACHGAELQGGIGFALNDAEWKHGGRPLQIKATVADGVPAAGMPGWVSMLGEETVNQVTAYILSHHSQP